MWQFENCAGSNFKQQMINWDAVFGNFQIFKFSNSQINTNKFF